MPVGDRLWLEWQGYSCACGEEALDAISDDELRRLTLMEARARVRELAKSLHKKPPRPVRKRHSKKPDEQEEAAASSEVVVKEEPAVPQPEREAEQATEPELRRPRGHGQAHPLSWRTWKDAQEGRINWRDKEF